MQLALANPGEPVMEKLHAANFIEHIGQDKIFLTVGDAVVAFAPKSVNRV